MPAGVAAGRLAAGAVAVEAHQLHVLVGLSFLEHVRPGADELGQRRRDRVLGHDRGEPVRKRQVREQRRIGPVERDDDRVRTLGLDALDLLGDRLAARRHLHPALQRRQHVVRRHLVAVVEPHALAERDRVHRAAVRDRRQALGEHRRHVPVRIEGVQKLVHLQHDGSDQIRGRRHRVERLGLADHRDIGSASARRRGQRRASRQRDRRRDGEVGDDVCAVAQSRPPGCRRESMGEAKHGLSLQIERQTRGACNRRRCV